MKRFLRWLILGGTLFFLAKALKDNWSGVTAIRIDGVGWAIIAIATGVTLLAHTWAGWIWTWILQELNQPVSSRQFIQVYLKTNIAKYLPGNIWHHYGRIVAAKNANISAGAATLSVLLEPLLMLAAALIIIVLCSSQFAAADTTFVIQILQLLSLAVVLAAIHPRFLNPVIRFLYKLKAKKSAATKPTVPFSLKNYPVRPLLGELGFMGLRATGFILTMLALGSLNVNQIPLLLGAFSCAWLLGFVIPGAPGGLGVFEATAYQLLQHHFPAAVVFSAIALYRLISILAETAGAAFAWLDERLAKS
ncbi:MAG: lysylphosphatidylglycerol synthase domain-containing protein [Nostoc sp. DedVER02]|uniref:lysylphosphatidylglycerol synthase domain-containing protein n=1 Tax=unclassified Nostoc TaxID=2593658 RepID=UPI002AD2FA13|nr:MULTISPECIES: lysylphosphatidylglycerol synthase domain-containing protein [unclassified Nostoc]MDZ7986754.1 lysylphosphatidylglycerol synthase domain-containing protein [Nostoc sp. DedVER02]MDZ8115656.1 lysylphosphatidylglycerol synthase domain-containing protein [Nostoc sp. DedVER01b]